MTTIHMTNIHLIQITLINGKEKGGKIDSRLLHYQILIHIEVFKMILRKILLILLNDQWPTSLTRLD